MLKLVFVAVIAADGIIMATAKSKVRCRKDEVWEKCPDSQCNPLTCSEVGFHINCPSLSSNSSCNCWGDPRCICKDGKVRDDDGNCINPEECPECGGDPNAVVNNCGRMCPDDVPCAAVCIPNTCECRKGYKYDQKQEKCVRKEKEGITSICGPFEVYSTCANGGCGKWNCTQIGQPDLCIDPIRCEGGCICKKGYLRDREGACVLEEQCYYDVCPKNEIYDLCPASCPSRTCGLDDKAVLCIKPLPVGDPNCPPPKCRCQDGFYRDHKGNCVTWDQCPHCSKPNEMYHPCPPKCPFRRCDIDDRLVKCARPPQLGDPACKPSCICEEGFVRNDKGYCVTREECPKCTGAHEVYDKCPITCPPQTCESIGKEYCCPAETPCKQCEGQCMCEPGYYRNKKGECIAKEDCLKCTGPHEFFSCWIACDNVCATLSVQNQTHCPIINVDCNRMCYCEEGYARDANNICVPINQCPQNQCTKPNEEYQQCPDCNPGTCETIGRVYRCPLRPCKLTDPGECRCKAGFYRNRAGDCVTEEQCAKERCNKPNEEYQQCVKDCSPGTCESIGKSYNCPARPNCKGQCRCKPGYFWNKLGDCITKKQCLKCNGTHEYFSCGPACDNVCATLDKQNKTNCPIINKRCNEMCYCEDEYARDENNVCVPIDQCKVKCSGPNEFYSCGGACDNVCSNLSTQNQTHCPIINIKCNEMCYCEEGYARDAKKICVPIDQCPQNQCTKPNEEYQQCPDCNPGTCETIGKVYHCPLRPCKLTDPGKCRCKAGFYRNKAGDCVTEEQCAKERCNKPNEEYQQCVKDCSPGTCESIGKSYNCPARPNCKGQCRCKPGYFWNKLGDCITKKQCLKCNGTHEYFSCGPACDNVCATLDKQNKTNCPIINKRCNEMCYCEDEYARDEKNVCVPIEQCKAQCTKPNEVFHPCPPKCPPRRCDVDDRVIRCAAPPKLGDPECDPGCICADGFVRNDKGYCVTRDQCPQNQCNKPHEEYHECPSCSPGTCESIGKDYSCAHPADPSLCRGACRCESGYYWNHKGECIIEEECLKCSGPNEFYSCGGACDNVCSNLSTQNQTHCPIINIKCNEMCYCDEGYARNDCNICIPIDHCPPETPTTTTPKPTTGSPPETCPSDGLELLLRGSAAFTAKFLYEVVKGNPKASVITSPASVLIPIAQLALYSDGTTYDELIEVLNLRNKDEIRCVFPQLISQLSTQKDVILNLAARIFATADFPLSGNFLEDTKNVFNAEAENVNFSDKVAAAKRINQWVEDQTNNRIQDIATPDMFSALTRLVLANAIYFLGNWEYQFNPNNTKARDFHRPDNSVIQLPTMYQEKRFRYANVSSLDCTLLEIPYKGNFSFLIYLPNKNDGVLGLLQNLLDPSVFYDAYDSMQTEIVQIYLPKMNVTMEFDLADIMKKTGINQIFNTNGAGLSGILKTDEPLFVSAAMQKAFILVNEIGTEAAAANVVVVGTTSARDTFIFNADHPFVFYILSGRDPIFCGVFS